VNGIDVLGAVHSALAPAGPQAARIARLAWLLFGMAAVVYVVVLLATAWALARRRHGALAGSEALARSERRAGDAVALATTATVITLIALVVVSFTTGRGLAALGDQHPVIVDVTGHQWWWEFEYVAATPSERARTANEIHIPVGEAVLVRGTSPDVIHSFWVPALHGKMDLIPGHPNQTWLRADTAGTFRGQCAEFCGYQHAHMAFTVVAEPRPAFEAWVAAQRQPAAEPSDALARTGRETFLAGSCALCHTIRGTPAGATTGPDLTHLMSRGALGAGTLPNLPGHLAGWIVDPQSIKPGVRMPSNHLDPASLQALLAYLETLG
jgi:cytochrome c oxidase subunit 2